MVTACTLVEFIGDGQLVIPLSVVFGLCEVDGVLVHLLAEDVLMEEVAGRESHLQYAVLVSWFCSLSCQGHHSWNRSFRSPWGRRRKNESLVSCPSLNIVVDVLGIEQQVPVVQTVKADVGTLENGVVGPAAVFVRLVGLHDEEMGGRVEMQGVWAAVVGEGGGRGIGLPVHGVDAGCGISGYERPDAVGAEGGVEGDGDARRGLVGCRDDAWAFLVFCRNAVAHGVGCYHLVVLLICHVPQQIEHEHASLREAHEGKLPALVLVRHIVVESLAHLFYHLLVFCLELVGGQADGIERELVVVGGNIIEVMLPDVFFHIRQFFADGLLVCGSQQGAVRCGSVAIFRRHYVGRYEVQEVDLVGADGVLALVPCAVRCPVNLGLNGGDL